MWYCDHVNIERKAVYKKNQTALRGIRLRCKHIRLELFTMSGDRDLERGILLELSLTGQITLICFHRFEIDVEDLISVLQSAEQDCTRSA